MRKVISIQLQEFPTPPYCRCSSVTKRSDSGIAVVLKALKCIFETPHNEIKCVLSIIESYSIEKKNGQKFSHLLMVRANGAPPMVSLTVKYPFFYAFPLLKRVNFCQSCKIMDSRYASASKNHVQIKLPSNI